MFNQAGRVPATIRNDMKEHYLHYISIYEGRAFDLRARFAEGARRGSSAALQEYRRRWADEYSRKADDLRNKLNQL